MKCRRTHSRSANGARASAVSMAPVSRWTTHAVGRRRRACEPASPSRRGQVGPGILPEFLDCIGDTCPSRKPHGASKSRQHGRCCRPMWDLCKLIWWAFIGLFRLRVALVAENLALRQQINVLRRTAPKRPRFGSIDRLIFVGLFRGLSTARDALAIVQPATVIRWHRAGF